MERFRACVLVVAVVLAAAALAGCGGSSDAPALPLSSIDNTSQGAAAASAGLQAQDVAMIGVVGALASPTADSFGISPTGKPEMFVARDPNIQLAGETAKNLAAQVRSLGAVRSVYAPFAAGRPGPLVSVSDNGTMPGSGGGYFTWRRSYDSATQLFSIEISFFDYKDNAALEIVNGTLGESGRLPNPADNTHVTVSLATRLGKSAAEPLTIETYVDSGFSSLKYRTSYYLVANFDTSATIYPGVDNSAQSINVSVPAGTLRQVSGPGGTGDNAVVLYNGYTVNVAVRRIGDTASTEVTANGSFQFALNRTSGNASYSQTFTNMRWTDRSTLSVSSDATIDGIVSFAFTPVLNCTDNVTSWTYSGGTYAFATAVPIHFDAAQGHTTAGQFSINGVVTVTFNADGTITVTVKGVPINLLVDPTTVCTIDVAG